MYGGIVGTIVTATIINLIILTVEVVVFLRYGGRITDGMQGLQYAMLRNQQSVVNAHRSHLRSNLRELDDTAAVVARRIDQMEKRIPKPPAPASRPVRT